MEMQHAKDAVERLEQDNRRRRSENKQMVEYLIPIFLGILGAAIASLSIEIIFKSTSCNIFYNGLFKSALVLIVLSCFVGVMFLFAEKKVFAEDELAKALQSLDYADISTKPKTYYLALVELTNMRAGNKTGSPEQRKLLENAFNAHKNDLHLWTMVKDAENFFTPKSRLLSQKLFWSFLVLGGLGILLFISFFLLVI